MATVETATSASTHAAFFVERITVRNFKGIEHLELELKPGLSLLVGRNIAGKSRLLRALHIAVGDVSVERDDLTVGSDEPAEIDVVIAPLPVVAKTATDTSIGLGSQAGATDELFDQALLQVLGESVALVSDSPVRQRFGC